MVKIKEDIALTFDDVLLVPAFSDVLPKDVDITTVISSVSRITGRTFIVDPRVKGKVTIIASHDVAEEELNLTGEVLF